MLTRSAPAKVAGGRVLLSAPSQESPLQLALDRAVRAGRPTAVLMVGLSRMPAAAIRPHHRRVCRAVLELAAHSLAGQVFTCPNGDLVLLATPDWIADTAATLGQMFRAETCGREGLLSLWTVPGDEAALQTQLDELRTAPRVAAEDPPAPIGAIAAVGALLASASDGALIQRQTGVRIAAGEMSPLYREISFALAALENQVGLPIPAGADPYLFRHFAAELDSQMLAALARSGFPTRPALHINLTLPGVMSSGFRQLLAGRSASGTELGVELQLLDVVADLAGFAKAQDVLREAGCRLVLDGVDDTTLMLATPDALAPDMLKLNWSPRLEMLPARDRRVLQRTMDRLGAHRIVLQRAETEAALSWGLAQGIQCFQGRYVDAMLAADRLTACAHAGGCTLRQCIDRAAACDPAGRAGCLDTSLLDGLADQAALS